jgi:hypothetical protein
MEESKKSLTLHLYRKDEVLAAMRWAIVNHNISESIYWGLELFDSDMEQDALEILEFIWITEIGFSSFTFLTHILDIYKTGELDRDSWISLLNCMSRETGRDSTVFYILIRGATMASEWKPAFPHRHTYTSIEQAVQDTLRRGKILEAWLLARAMKAEEQYILLETLAIQRKRHDYMLDIMSSNLSDYVKRSIAFVLVSLNDTQWQSATKPLVEREIPVEVKEAIDEWDSEESLRKRRVYKIRSSALISITERSEQSQQESSEYEIQSDLLKTLLESPYWTNILDDYMDNGKWKSDSYHEMFFSTYFPCDIPDEWSSQDREKSHGRGLGRSPEVGLKRFIDALFQRSKSVEIWNLTIPETYTHTLDWHTTYSDLYSKCKEHLESNLPFKPIIKSFEISL